MAENSKNPFRFWQELKQRKVVRVITVYVASAAAILQAVDIIFSRLGFPSWTVTLVMILLAVGLVGAIILSWIYDITPEGIKKTKDLENVKIEDSSDIGIELPYWKSTATQSRENIISYENEFYIEKIKQYKKKGRIYNYSSAVVILAVIVLFTFSSANTVPFIKRDWIVITDFENLTENPVFDKSLYTAFSLSINQSSYVNIFPRSRMLETLTRMKIKGQAYIDDKTGREIAIREGIYIYIVPSISKVGNRYVITAKILETKTGNLLRSEILYAETQDEILAKLDQLSKKIRRNLGESRYNIATQDKPLKKVTTSSLEALKLYSLGSDHQIMLDFAGAKDYYENALRIDSNFTAAKASLGSLLIEKFDDIKGRELLNQAIKSIDNLTEREKLGILGFHAVNVENNIPKGIEYAKMRIELYPDDPAAHNNLGWYYQNLGQFEEALKEYKATVQINPNMAFTYSAIVWVYLDNLGKADSALVWSEKMISDNPQNAWGYINRGSAWLCIDSLKRAEMAFEKARQISPNITLNLFRLAHAFRLQRHYNEAIGILKKIPEIDQNEASVYYDLGVNYQAMGNQEEARKHFSIFKKIVEDVWMKRWPDDAGTYIALGAVTARLSDMDSSKQMLQKAIEIDSTLHDRFAEVLCIQGNVPEALNQLEKAFNKGYRDLFWLKLTPDLQILHNDPQFRVLMDKFFK